MSEENHKRLSKLYFLDPSMHDRIQKSQLSILRIIDKVSMDYQKKNFFISKGKIYDAGKTLGGVSL